METSAELKNLAPALVKVQSKLKGAIKDSENPFFHSKYADLASVWDACRSALTENGFSVSQGTGGDGNTVTVTTLLLHSSGEWIKDTLGLIPKDKTPQGIGSCITYGRRYSLAAMVGVNSEDDDGAAASGTVKSKAQERPGFGTGIPASEHDAKLAEKKGQSDLGSFPDYIIEVRKGKNGINNGKPWQAFVIVTQDHGEVGTYSQVVADLCTKAGTDGKKVMLHSTPGKYGPVADAAELVA